MSLSFINIQVVCNLKNTKTHSIQTDVITFEPFSNFRVGWILMCQLLNSDRQGLCN